MRDIVYGGITSIAVGILVIACICVTGCVGENISPIVEKIELVSLERETMIEGHYSGGFFIGSGYVKSVPSYFYYIKLANGGYKLKTVPTEECIIFMDENTSPYLVAGYDDGYRSGYEGVYGETGDEDISRKSNDSATEDYYKGQKTYSYIHYSRTGDVELHIPANSIIKEYKP